MPTRARNLYAPSDTQPGRPGSEAPPPQSCVFGGLDEVLARLDATLLAAGVPPSPKPSADELFPGVPLRLVVSKRKARKQMRRAVRR